MFTGIIQEQGRVIAVTPQSGGVRLTISATRAGRRARRGGSLAVNGVCLTVVAARPPQLTFDVIAETLRCTTLGRLRPGDRVHIEPALRWGQPIDGHLVLGHVDGVGRVQASRADARGRWLDIELPAALARSCVSKGSIAVDGVSLTLGRCRRDDVRVFLVPETLKRTTLGARRAGGLVNVEIDVLVKIARARGRK